MIYQPPAKVGHHGIDDCTKHVVAKRRGTIMDKEALKLFAHHLTLREIHLSKPKQLQSLSKRKANGK